MIISDVAHSAKYYFSECAILLWQQLVSYPTSSVHTYPGLVILVQLVLSWIVAYLLSGKGKEMY